MPRVGEGLHHAVVGNGDGRVAPCRRLLDDAGGIGQCVHVGHAGVEMQLHPLLRTGILAALVADLSDAQGPQLHVLSVAGQLHHALQAQPHAGIDEARQRLGLLFVHVFAHSDASGIVGHVEGQAPQARPPRLVHLGGKDLALHYDGAHLGVQVHHGDGLALDGLAHQQFAAARLFGGGLGRLHRQPQVAQVILLHQQLAYRLLRGVRQRLAALNLQLHGAVLPIQHAAGHRRVMQQQPQLTGRHEAVKKIKKRYFIRHNFILFSVWWVGWSAHHRCSLRRGRRPRRPVRLPATPSCVDGTSRTPPPLQMFTGT